MDDTRKCFLNFSSELTGYSKLDLEGTGMVDEYRKLMEKEIGSKISGYLYEIAGITLDMEAGTDRDHAMRVNIIASSILWPVCGSLVVLWYRGQWTSMSSVWYKYYAGVSPARGVIPGKVIVPSAAAYTQQLSYRAAGAHPPGAHPTGFGSWGVNPVFGDFITA